MTDDNKKFNIQPLALPNTPVNEVWFEQPRDTTEVVVQLRSQAPVSAGLCYRKKHWPQRRFERASDLENPGAFGWQPMDDWFNGEWKEACVQAAQEGNTLAIRFQPLSAEQYDGDWSDYDVIFRRTMAIRLDGIADREIASVQVFTHSPAAAARVRSDARLH